MMAIRAGLDPTDHAGMINWLTSRQRGRGLGQACGQPSITALSDGRVDVCQQYGYPETVRRVKEYGDTMRNVDVGGREN